MFLYSTYCIIQPSLVYSLTALSFSRIPGCKVRIHPEGDTSSSKCTKHKHTHVHTHSHQFILSNPPYAKFLGNLENLEEIHTDTLDNMGGKLRQQLSSGSNQRPWSCEGKRLPAAPSCHSPPKKDRRSTLKLILNTDTLLTQSILSHSILHNKHATLLQRLRNDMKQNLWCMKNLNFLQMARRQFLALLTTVVCIRETQHERFPLFPVTLSLAPLCSCHSAASQRHTAAVTSLPVQVSWQRRCTPCPRCCLSSALAQWLMWLILPVAVVLKRIYLHIYDHEDSFGLQLTWTALHSCHQWIVDNFNKIAFML